MVFFPLRVSQKTRAFLEFWFSLSSSFIITAVVAWQPSSFLWRMHITTSEPWMVCVCVCVCVRQRGRGSLTLNLITGIHNCSCTHSWEQQFSTLTLAFSMMLALLPTQWKGHFSLTNTNISPECREEAKGSTRRVGCDDDLGASTEHVRVREKERKGRRRTSLLTCN